MSDISGQGAQTTGLGNMGYISSKGALISDVTPSIDGRYPCGKVYTNIWYFSAPKWFYRDLSKAYGGRLQFSLLALPLLFFLLSILHLVFYVSLSGLEDASKDIDSLQKLRTSRKKLKCGPSGKVSKNWLRQVRELVLSISTMRAWVRRLLLGRVTVQALS